MPTHDALDRPQERPRRFGLFFPFILVLLALGGWTLWWFMVAGRVEQETDRAAVSLRQAGYQVAWSGRTVEGWPFRTFVKFSDFKVTAPSGHALAAPRLQAEANTYDLGKWVAVAPDGVTLTRGSKGEVKITGQAIRASASGLQGTPPRIALGLVKPVFAPAPGAEPFPLVSADLVAFEAKPWPNGAAGEGAFLMRVNGGKPRPDGMLDWIGKGQPFAMEWEGKVTALDRFTGTGWPQAARAWAAAGGVVSAVRGTATAGAASLDGSAPRLSVGPDGRLRGSVSMTLKGGPQSLMALGRSEEVDRAGATAAAAATAVAGGLDGVAKVRLDFTDEGAKIGPFRLSGSPAVY